MDFYVGRSLQITVQIHTEEHLFQLPLSFSFPQQKEDIVNSSTSEVGKVVSGADGDTEWLFDLL